MFCAIGATASSIADGTNQAEENGALRAFALVFGVLFALLGAGVASYYSKIELDKIVNDQTAPGTTLLETADDEEHAIGTYNVAEQEIV